MDAYFVPIVLAAIAGGASTGALGVYLVGMRMPLVALAISHAAMVGAVAGLLVGWPPLLCAFAVASAVSASLAVFRPEAVRLDPTSGLAVIFSLMLGLVFLGMGLFSGPPSELLVLVWGNLLWVDWPRLYLIAGAGLALGAFVLVFSKELKAILFSRFLAGATGVHEGLVTAVFLALAGLVITANLYVLGGLMIYSLLINPAAAAFQIARGHRATLALASSLGAGCAFVGFWISYCFDVPTGASIVLASAAAFGLAVAWRRLAGRRD
jgi:manganese/iron transport system permease protein